MSAEICVHITQKGRFSPSEREKTMRFWEASNIQWMGRKTGVLNGSETGREIEGKVRNKKREKEEKFNH